MFLGSFHGNWCRAKAHVTSLNLHHELASPYPNHTTTTHVSIPPSKIIKNQDTNSRNLTFSLLSTRLSVLHQNGLRRRPTRHSPQLQPGVNLVSFPFKLLVHDTNPSHQSLPHPRTRQFSRNSSKDKPRYPCGPKPSRLRC